jgi:glycosyltransferase involved in cell wall biosynthesis
VRIAIVGTELCAVDARGGGLEQVLRRWAAALADHHDVVLVSLRPVVPDAHRVVVIRSPADLAGIDADVVSLHNRPQWSSLCSPRARVGVTFHNYPAAWKTRRRRFPGVGLSAVSRSLAAVAASQLGVDTVSVVPPSIDPAYCAPVVRRPERTVLSPNRLMRKKGVMELLDVARLPAFAGIGFEFADLISPWLRPTAEHRALRSAIRSVPNASLFAPASPLTDRYATAGVVVCAAQEPEGLGLVPLEAQACGAPVVTTDSGGLREATFPPNACVPVGDRDALAAALLAALSRPSSSGRMVIDRYAPAASAAAFERWLASLG